MQYVLGVRHAQVRLILQQIRYLPNDRLSYISLIPQGQSDGLLGTYCSILNRTEYVYFRLFPVRTLLCKCTLDYFLFDVLFPVCLLIYYLTLCNSY